MTAVRSPLRSRPNSVNTVELEFRGSVTPRARGHAEIHPPRPQKLLPSPEPAVVELLPKVLQPYVTGLCVKTPPPSSSVSRPRTQPPSPTSTPPLLVRSFVVAPRSACRSASRLHSALSMHSSRQKSASPSVRMSYISIVHSPNQSPMLEASPTFGNTPVSHAVENDPRTIAANPLASKGNNMEGNNMGHARPPFSLWRPQEAAYCQCVQAMNDDSNNPSLTPTQQNHESTTTDKSLSNTRDAGLASDSDGNNQPTADDNGEYRLKRPSCRRSLANELEKELTFKPELNQKSVRMASRSTRQGVPLVCRLTERRKKSRDYDDFSFAPRINPHSIKLAQERASKIDEVRARIAQQAAKTSAEVQSKYTFKPQVSVKSLRIAEMLGTSFEKRQEIHMEKRKKVEVPHPPPLPPKVRPNKPPLANYLAPDLTSRPPSPAPAYSPTGAKTAPPSPMAAKNTPTASKTAPPSSTPNRSVNSNILSEATPLSVADAPPVPTSGTQGERLCKDVLPHSIASNTQIKARHRKRTSVFASKPASKVKCRTLRRRESTGACGSTPPVTRRENLEFEGVSFGELRSERDRVKYVKMVAEKKITEKKIFLIHGGYRLVRKCLRNRGWVELDYHKNKNPSNPPAQKKGSRQKEGQRAKVKGEKEAGDSSGDDDDSDVDLDLGVTEEVYHDEEEYSMVARVVRNSAPNFVWTLSREAALYDSLHKSTITNHFAKASSFTTKNDLCTNLRNLLWHGDRSPDTFFPRCYCLCSGPNEDTETFLDDYRFTAAVSILKILSQRHSFGCSTRHSASRRRSASLRSSSSTLDETGNEQGGGSVPERAVQLALKAGEAYLGSKYHDDIEKSDLHLCPRVLKSEWDELIQYFYKIRAGCDVEYTQAMISSINDLLNQIEAIAPQFNLDGNRNIWIIKPGSSSRGRGITCLSRLEDIMATIFGNAGVARKVGRYVVQKYIERPLLIYETKFDIRQWFLVTDWNPLTMWMYQDSYLRFSSQPYTLDSMDVSIHLCNQSIQKHYTNSLSRSEQLPAENMWDSHTFQKYLNSIGKGKCWEEVIYPGMRDALIHSLQVSQGEIEHRKNCFELYGADFMVCADFKPWLIEINSSPTMEGSTEITARLCQQVLEDTLRVVIDRRENKDCDTGRFELAFKQAKVDAPPYVGMQLCVKGSAMKLKNSSSSSTSSKQKHVHLLENLCNLTPKNMNSALAYTTCCKTLKLSYQTPMAEIML